jgi:hypothetical protein
MHVCLAITWNLDATREVYHARDLEPTTSSEPFFFLSFFLFFFFSPFSLALEFSRRSIATISKAWRFASSNGLSLRLSHSHGTGFNDGILRVG